MNFSNYFATICTLIFFPPTYCFVLDNECHIINRWDLFKTFLTWSIIPIPFWMMVYLLCSFWHNLLSHPLFYRRRFNAQGELLETADSYSRTELEAVDAMVDGYQRDEIQEACLRVHPSSRKMLSDNNEINWQTIVNRTKEEAITAEMEKDEMKKKLRHRMLDPTIATEDSTQPSLTNLSKTQSLSPTSSEFFRPTQATSQVKSVVSTDQTSTERKLMHAPSIAIPKQIN